MIGVMFYINWRFTFIALSIVPALFVVVYTFTRRIRKASRAVRKNESQLVSIVQEVLTSMRVVKAFAREDFEVLRFETQSRENVETALEARSIKAKLTPIVDVMVAIGTCLVLGYGARLALNGNLSAGVLVVFLLYLGKMYKPMRELSKLIDTVSKSIVGYERIQEVLQIHSGITDSAHARPAPRFKGHIEFERVSFGYDEKVEVLRNVSFSIKPGQVVALVGPSGTGKTTIISLIPRFFDPQSGTVKIDGKDVNTYQLKSLREQISFVLQDTVLFHTTILENIAYGRPFFSTPRRT
jgi:ATP-binding cassette, subfamily B, bacterial